MWKRVFNVLLLAAVLAAIMQAIRLLIIEPDDMAALCEINKTVWKCALRDVVIQGFARHLYGPISLAAAALAWFTSTRGVRVGVTRAFAMLAMLFGMAGAVFYDFDWAAVGLLLGALLLLRERHRDKRIASIVEYNTPTQ